MVDPFPTKDVMEFSEQIDDHNVKINEYRAGFPCFNTYFTENRGQIDNPDVLFYVHGSIAFTRNAVIFHLHKSDPASSTAPLEFNGFDKESNRRVESAVFVINFENSNDVIPIGIDELSHRSNYFIGNSSTKWRTNVPNYASIKYHNIYDGIDLIYGIKDSALKYDFVISPNVETSQIRLTYDGVEALASGSDGSLLITTPVGVLRDSSSYIYQEIEGTKVEIIGGFKILGESSVGFDIKEPYDRNLPLIIDPGLEWSTFLGGIENESWPAIVLDSNEDIYITGGTSSSDFPTTAGVYDTSLDGGGEVFVVKLNSYGTKLLFSTFIGGSDIYGENAFDIVLDSAGNIYIAGNTYSTDFPTTANAYDDSYNGDWGDAFVAKLNNNGTTLLYSTYLGGSDNDGGNGVALDPSGNIYISGNTFSSDFPTTPGAYDTWMEGKSAAFVAKLNSSGTVMLYSTFLGGIDRTEIPPGLLLDSSGNAYLTGSTRSSDFPTTPGAYDTTFNGEFGDEDAFVAKLSSNGTSLFFSTFLGGSNYEVGWDITLDSTGNIYIIGDTRSSDFPTTSDAFDTSFNGRAGEADAFVAKLNNNGTTLLYSTFFGGSDWDVGRAVTLDTSGYIYITGCTRSLDFPTTPGAYDTLFNCGWEAFVTKLNGDGTAVLYSTFLGGTGEDWGWKFVLDSNRKVIISGYTYSSDFPTSADAYDPSHNGWCDNFVAKLNLSIPLPPNLYIDTLTNKNDIFLYWDEPLSLGTYYFLIYNATTPTGFDFSSPWINTSLDVDPLGPSKPVGNRLSWNHTGAADPGDPGNYSEQWYYCIRTVNNMGDMSSTSRTVGKWTKKFSKDISTFSIPLEPLGTMNRTIDFYLNDMNASYIKWMDPKTHTWMKHGDNSVNDTQMEVGKGYEVKFDSTSKYTFLGLPGAMIRFNSGTYVGFDYNTDAKSLSATVDPLTGNVTLTWNHPSYMGVNDSYVVYYSETRDGFHSRNPNNYSLLNILPCCTNVTVHPGVALPGTQHYYMVVPVNDTRGEGASTYSIGVWTEGYTEQYDTMGIPLILSGYKTVDVYCDEIDNTVGINYFDISVQKWSWHSLRMPKGAYDPILKMTEGYQISTSDTTKCTFIGI
jgi:hypothetical protein